MPLPIQVAEKAIANLESIQVLPEHSQPQSKAEINFVTLGEWWICHFFTKSFLFASKPRCSTIPWHLPYWCSQPPGQMMSQRLPKELSHARLALNQPVVRLHHEFQNLFHRLMQWVPKVLEALQQIPTLDENDCFQDHCKYHTSLGSVGRKICWPKNAATWTKPNFCKSKVHFPIKALASAILSWKLQGSRGSLREGISSNDIKKLVNHFPCPKKTWPCRAIFDVVIYKHIYVYVGTCKRKHIIIDNYMYVLVRGFHFQPQKFPRCQFHSWKMLRKGAKNFVVSACNSSCAPPW